MAQQGLRFEDILKSQEKLAAQGDKTAAATIQRLQEMERTLKAEHTISKQDRVLQAAQTYEAVKADKDDDRIADATEKTADTVEEVDKNVVKLVDAVKCAVGPGQVVAAPAEGIPSAVADRVAQATVDVDAARAKGPLDGFKQLGSLKSWFDTSGPSKGMLDDIIRRRIEKTEFIKTQQEVGGVSKEVATQRYKETDKLKRQADTIKSQIEVYKKQGLSEEQIQGTSAYQRLQTVQGKIAAADPLVRERALGQEVNRVEKTFAAATGVTPATFQAPLVATREAKMDLLGGSEEQQLEQQRMWQEELNVLKKIEENTRVLVAVGEKLDKLDAKLGTPGEAAPAGGGGIDIPMLPGGRGGKPAPKPAPKGKVPAGAGKIGGLVKGAAVLSVAAGAYEAYSGWTGASEEEKQQLEQIQQAEAAGEITPEQAEAAKKEVVDVTDVKQSEAVGGGIGTAAGGMLGATAGAKIGATIGTFIAPGVGTAIGGAIGAVGGGIVGAIAGSGVGQDIARWGAQGWQATRDFFGGKKKELPVKATEKDINVDVSEADFQKNDPDGFNQYKKFKEETEQKVYKQIRTKQKKEFGKNADQPELEQTARTEAETIAKKEAAIKFQKRIEAANAGSVKVSNAGGQPSDTSTSAPGAPGQGQTVVAQPSTEQVARGAVEPMSAEDSAPIRVDSTEDNAPIRVDGEQIGTMGPEGIVTQPGQDQLLREVQSQAREMATLGVAMPTTPAVGDMVYAQSEANAAAAATPASAPSAPVVINAPTNVQQTSNYGAKSPPRNTESSYIQYNRSKY